MEQKFCSFFMEPKITNCKDETVNHANIYLLLSYFGARKVFRRIMEHMFIKVWFPLSFNMR